MNKYELNIFRQGRLGDPLGQALIPAVPAVAQVGYYTLPKNEQGFVGLYVLPCYDTGESVEQYQQGEKLEPGHFYGLYGHEEGEGREHIGDFTTFEAACAVAEKLGGVA